MAKQTTLYTAKIKELQALNKQLIELQAAQLQVFNNRDYDALTVQIHMVHVQISNVLADLTCTSNAYLHYS